MIRNYKCGSSAKLLGVLPMFIKRETYLSLLEENEDLRNKMDSIHAEMQQKEELFKRDIFSFDQELTLTMNQHEVVNGQHQKMGVLISKIKEQFNKVNDLSQYSYDNSKNLSNKGGNLIESAKDMVSKSKEGQESVGRVEQLILQLGEQLGGTYKKMNQLNERSKEIELIVKVIKEIADQTNLLALNASVLVVVD